MTPDVQSLLDRFASLQRQHVEIEHEIAAVEDEILALSDTPRPRRARSTRAEVDEQVKLLLKTLQEAGEPLPPSELASRLDIAPMQISHRLRQAISLGFARKAGGGRYTVAAEVPVL